MTEPKVNKLKKKSFFDVPPDAFLKSLDSWTASASVPDVEMFTSPITQGINQPQKKTDVKIFYCVFFWRNIEGLGESTDFRKYTSEAELEKTLENHAKSYLESSDYLEWRMTPFMMILSEDKPATYCNFISKFLAAHPEHFYYKRNKTPKQYINGPKANYANSSKHL